MPARPRPSLWLVLSQKLIALGAGFFLVLAASAARAPEKAAEPPLKVVLAASKGQLAKFQKYLEQNYHVSCTAIEAAKTNEITGVEKLDDADVLLLNLYRSMPTEEQLERFQKHFRAGKPVVGLRKASHAFQNWLEVDKAVFGVKYGGHFLLNKKDLVVQIEDKAKNRSLIGDLKPFLPGGGLYKYTDLAPDVEVLMTGGEAGNMMPQTWTRVTKEGQHIFYTRYDPNDLDKDEGCRQMVVNALYWAAGRKPLKKQ